MSTATIKWLIESSNLENLHLLTCHHKADTSITSVNILDTPDVVRWIKPNELVLTNGYLFSDNEETQRQIIRNLSSVGACALGIKIRRFFKEVPKAMLEESEKVNLPIIELPFYYAFSDICRVIFHKIFLQNTRSSRREIRLFSGMTSSLFSGKSLDVLLRHISQIYHTTTMICTPTGNVTAINYDENTKEIIIPDRISGFNPTSKGEPMIIQISGINTSFLTLPIQGSNSYLLMLETTDNRSMLRREILTLEHTALILSIKLEQMKLKRLQHTNGDNAFYHMLLNPTEDISTDEIIHICTAHGFDYKKKRICISISPKQGSPVDMRTLPEIVTSHTEKYSEANGSLFTLFPVVGKDQFCIFLLSIEQIGNPRFISLARDVIRSLHKTLPPELFSNHNFCIGRCHQSVESIPFSLKECTEVVNLMSPVFQDQNVFNTSSIAAYRVLNNMDPKSLRQIYLDTVAELAEYDHANETDLLKTLDVYFKCQFNATQAANLLYIHRNTMLHRLEKIKKILQSDMQDNNEILSIYMGLCISELIG